MDPPSHRSWSDLPIEILELFLDRLFFSDHNRFGAVCKPWRTAAAKHRPPPIPWLVLSQDRATQIWTFFSPVYGGSYRLKLPVAPGGRCFGSSHGWLLMTDGILGHYLLNPCTNEQLQLPLFSNPEPQYVPLFLDHDPEPRYAILALSPYKLLTAPEDCAAVAICHHRLAYCRLADILWSAFPKIWWNDFARDILFHKGLLYRVNYLGAIAVFEFGPQPEIISKVKTIDCLSRTKLENTPNHDRRKFYLVDCAGEVMMIVRYQKYLGSRFRTVWLHVFNLNRDVTTKWVPVESLGGAMLFLGTGCSRSFPAASNSAFKSNCICFVDVICFVFSLEDGGIQPYRQDDPSLLLKEDAFWFWAT